MEFNNVYGDDTMINPGLYYNYHAINMMMSLTGNVVDEGNFIYVDSWYKLVESSKGLGRHLTDIIGTVKEDWKNLPKDVMNAKLNKEEGGSSLFTPIQCHVYAIERQTRFLHGFNL